MFSVGFRRGLASHFLNNIFFLCIVVVIYIAVYGWVTPENQYTYIYASLFGTLWVTAFLFFNYALGSGLAGLVTLFFSFSIIIPIITDLTVLGTRITLFQIAGITLLFISFYIGNRPAVEKGKSVSLRFIIICIVGIFFNGLVLAVVKLHQGAMPGVDIIAFVFYGFIAAALVSALCFIFFYIRESKKETLSYKYMFRSPKYYLQAAGSGVTTAIGNILMLAAASLLPAAIQFPIMTGGRAIIVAVLSILIFQEKFTKKTAVVFAIGIAALAIINF